MTDDERDDAQGKGWTPEELALFAAAGIDPATARKTRGMATEVAFTAVDETPSRAVIVPDGRLPGATEDVIILVAAQHRDDFQNLEESFTPEQIDAGVAALEASGIFRTLTDMAGAIVRERTSLTPVDAPDDLTDDERPRVTERTAALMHDEALRALTRAILSGEDAPAFKRGFVRHLLAQSWAWALSDAREIAAKWQALSGEPMPADAFTKALHHTYRAGTYYDQALIHHTHDSAGVLAKQAFDALAAAPNLLHRLAQTALQDIRGEDYHPRKTPATDTPPIMTPGFRDGWGLVPNDPIHRGVIESMQNAADGAKGWQYAPDQRPFFAVSGTGSWAATFFVSSEGDYATPEAAWALVQQLDDETADTLDIALCQWLANRHRDPSGLVYITASDILAQKGRAKEPHGGYKTDDKRAAAQHMQALAALEVEGRNFERYEPAKGKGRRKKLTLAPVGKLLEISVREELKHLDGTRGPAVGWFYRVGAWSVAFQHDPAATPILASMSQKVIAYDSYQAKHAKRLGRYLAWQFRTRAFERSYAQPWTVGSLLAGAGIELPGNNPARFRKRIEDALAMLLNDGVIGAWQYGDTPDLPPYNWLPRWLDWRITVLPPADLVALYAKIGSRGRIAAGKTAS